MPDHPIGPTSHAWLTSRLARDEIAPATYRTYASHLRWFAAHVGPERELASITAWDIEAWLASMDVEPASRNTRCATVRAFMAWAAERHLIPADPARQVRRARAPIRPLRVISDEDLALVLDRAGFRARVLITVAVQMMLRVGELAKLRVEDYDRAARTLYVQGKGRRDRILPVTDEARDALDRWLADERRSGPMWPSLRRPGAGLTTRAIGGIITSAAADVGVGLTPHGLRHKGASDAAAAGAPLPALRDALGHANVATTSIYVHTRSEEVARAMAGRTYRLNTRGPQTMRATTA